MKLSKIERVSIILNIITMVVAVSMIVFTIIVNNTRVHSEEIETESTGVCDCTCPVEEPTEATEPSEPLEPSEPTEPPAIIEPTIDTEPTDVADIIELGEFKLTAYCPCGICCGQWTDGITSTGVTAKAGRTIAVDPDIIPYGSLVEINGHTYVAEDCGGAIKGNRIDIYFDTHEEALKFGVQYADVRIVGS